MSTIDRLPELTARAPQSTAMVRNAWYMAAWSEEVAHEILARRIVDEPIVFYRTESGEVTALADRCPHRRFPLSLGKLDGDRLVCGYHGFTFDSAGTCVAVPGQTKIPGSANVRRFPTVERHGVVWVFPGDAERADLTNVPVAPWLSEWWNVRGYAHLNARASILLDNLLDLSHESYLHASHIGSPEVAETPITVERAGNVLHVDRRMLGVECPSFYKQNTGLDSPIDRSQEIEFYPPGFYVLHVRVAAAGDTGKGFRSKVTYGITPETATTVHDFWAISRDSDPNDRSNAQRTTDLQNAIVIEDVVALEELERLLASDRTPAPEVSIGIDRGGLVARRMIAELVRAERGEA